MKFINVHLDVQDELTACGRLPDFIGNLVIIASNHDATDSVFVESGDDSGRYYNITIGSDDVSSLWHLLNEAIVSMPSSEVNLVVTCQGKDEWNDYLLLYHFDDSEIIDTLPAV